MQLPKLDDRVEYDVPVCLTHRVRTNFELNSRNSCSITPPFLSEEGTSVSTTLPGSEKEWRAGVNFPRGETIVEVCGSFCGSAGRG